VTWRAREGPPGRASSVGPSRRRAEGGPGAGAASPEAFDADALLEESGHRPWELPDGRWSWRQSWHDLAFLHWPLPTERLRPLLPESLKLEARGGSAWIGVVPFRMTGIARRPLPPLPGLAAFPELNVRTYVTRDGKPGVWFFSLEAASRVAVWAARLRFHLPYSYARMRCDRAGEWIEYESVRRDPPRGLTFRARYRPTGHEQAYGAESLARWLTERYCLYSSDRRGRLYRAEIHHAPWPLRPGRAEIERNAMLEPLGLAVENPPPLVHVAGRQDVLVWSPEQV